jgi:phenylacetate-CoA ligase
VATDLYNYGMPFIRYDTGDQGVLSQEPCACGLRSPRLWVTGRYSSFLTFPARRFHHLEFDGAMDGYMNEVLRYQIAKQSDHDILVRIIPGPAFRDGVRESVRKRVQELVGGDIQIAVETVTSLPTTGRGKSRIVVDESAERQGAIIDNS